MRRIVFLFAIIFQSMVSLSQTGEDHYLDSLIDRYHSMSVLDTNKVLVCKTIAQIHYNVDSVVIWSERLYDLASRHKMNYYRGMSMFYLGWAYYYLDDSYLSMKYCFRGVGIADSSNCGNVKPLCHNLVGDNFFKLMNFENAEQYYREAVFGFKTLSDSSHYTRALLSLSALYAEFGLYDMAYTSAMESVRIDSLRNHVNNLSRDYGAIGDFLLSRYVKSFSTEDVSVLAQAKNMFIKSLSLKSDLPHLIADHASIIQTMCLENQRIKYTGRRYTDFIDSVHNYCLELDDMVAKTGMTESLFMFQKDISWAHYHLALRKYDVAKQLADSIYNRYSHDNMRSVLGLYRDYYQAVGNTDLLIETSNKYSAAILKEYSPDKAILLSSDKARKEFEEERQQMMLDEATKIYRLRSIYIPVVSAIGLLALFFIYVYIRKRQHFEALNDKNIHILKQNEEINKKNEKILAQRDQLEEKNNQITDSIHYASLIQQASLPKSELMAGLFNDYFLIYRPLHIVAGDFYWASQIGRYKLLSCADCTGHGVPGALLSMLGVSLLHEVSANLQDDFTAAEILNNLRSKFMNALGQSKKQDNDVLRSNMDGMDLAMVMIDYESMILQYAGAYRPLWIWRDGTILQYKPDKMPVGIYLGNYRFFTNHIIELRKGDILYMFSDGIPDQFGYEDDSHTSCKHFSTKKLLSLLTEIGGLPMEEQKSIIENEVDVWRNGYKQLDDNILVGVRI